MKTDSIIDRKTHYFKQTIKEEAFRFAGYRMEAKHYDTFPKKGDSITKLEDKWNMLCEEICNQYIPENRVKQPEAGNLVIGEVLTILQVINRAGMNEDYQWRWNVLAMVCNLDTARLKSLKHYIFPLGYLYHIIVGKRARVHYYQIHSSTAWKFHFKGYKKEKRAFRYRYGFILEEVERTGHRLTFNNIYRIQTDFMDKLITLLAHKRKGEKFRVFPETPMKVTHEERKAIMEEYRLIKAVKPAKTYRKYYPNGMFMVIPCKKVRLNTEHWLMGRRWKKSNLTRVERVYEYYPDIAGESDLEF